MRQKYIITSYAENVFKDIRKITEIENHLCDLGYAFKAIEFLNKSNKYDIKINGDPRELIHFKLKYLGNLTGKPKEIHEELVDDLQDKLCNKYLFQIKNQLTKNKMVFDVKQILNEYVSSRRLHDYNVDSCIDISTQQIRINVKVQSFSIIHEIYIAM